MRLFFSASVSTLSSVSSIAVVALKAAVQAPPLPASKGATKLHVWVLCEVLTCDGGCLKATACQSEASKGRRKHGKGSGVGHTYPKPHKTCLLFAFVWHYLASLGHVGGP